MKKILIYTFITSLFFISVQNVEAEEYEIGKYTVIIEESCDRSIYIMTDVVRDSSGSDTWRIVCELHKDGEAHKGINIFNLEEIIQAKEKSEKGWSQKNETEETEDVEEEKVEEGGFSIWIQDMTTGVSSFISGEILCKNEASKQPQKGSIVSMSGDIFITRGIKIFPATGSDALIGGDILTIRDESTATILLNDTGQLKISQKTRFQIPREPYTCARNKAIFGIKNGIGSIWNALKDNLKGESYEIKTPSGTPGVRG